ncbi:NAD(P)/FAD-dependent oxidoreductase [Nocardioides sambongensis]|uniref:NAD(P)/FAD-dependent oxidoreductase n=1 Tax=Nocardioides sambongensis TaxID=2589074 RepID=UPI001125C192|nr:NAD(P)/FAD-dependent oxidoreductase [Nocardioides sambongensis]
MTRRLDPTPTRPAPDYDVAVIGAGSAGLQAALTLGRMRRRTIVFGTDRYRNDPAHAMQNFLGHDGTPPAELRAAARKDVEAYASVTFADRGVTRISGAADEFVVEYDGDGPVTVRRIVLATGVVDELPDVPGLAELYGDVVAHCPYCHGHEMADGPIGFLGVGPHTPVLAELIGRLATEVVMLSNGVPREELDPATLAALGGADVRTAAVTGVRRTDDGVAVALADGAEVELHGLFVHPAWRQAAPFPEQLGLETGELGGVLVDIMGATSRPGVYAAGDLAHHRDLPMPMASVLQAAAAGQVAASAADRDLAMADVARRTA